MNGLSRLLNCFSLRKLLGSLMLGGVLSGAMTGCQTTQAPVGGPSVFVDPAGPATPNKGSSTVRALNILAEEYQVSSNSAIEVLKTAPAAAGRPHEPIVAGALQRELNIHLGATVANSWQIPVVGMAQLPQNSAGQFINPKTGNTASFAGFSPLSNLAALRGIAERIGPDTAAGQSILMFTANVGAWERSQAATMAMRISTSPSETSDMERIMAATSSNESRINEVFLAREISRVSFATIKAPQVAISAKEQLEIQTALAMKRATPGPMTLAELFDTAVLKSRYLQGLAPDARKTHPYTADMRTYGKIANASLGLLAKEIERGTIADSKVYTGPTLFDLFDPAGGVYIGRDGHHHGSSGHLGGGGHKKSPISMTDHGHDMAH